MLKALLARPSTALVLAAALAVLPTAASAEPAPSNDEIAGATSLSLPGRVEDHDTSGATAGADDPQECWSGYTVWFQGVAPRSGTLVTTAFASIVVPPENPDDPNELPTVRDLPTGVAVFTGEPGALRPLGCAYHVFGEWREGGPVHAAVTAGDVVHVVAGALQANSAGTRISVDVQYASQVEAPQVDVTVDRVGTVSRQGAATVSGTLRCDVVTTGSLSLALTQRTRRGGLRAVADSTGSGCSPAGTSWSLTLPQAGPGSFRPGVVTLRGSVSMGEDVVTVVPVAEKVVLRRERRATG